MNAARMQTMQGMLFCMLALVVTAASLWLPRLDIQTELIIMAVLIMVLGVPHGALDTIFAENFYRVDGFGGWVLFTLAYFLPAILVVAVWYAAPTLFLAGFLAISVAHFSGDLSPGTPPVTRLLYGGAVIILPTLLHSAEIGQLFSLLVGPTAAQAVLWWLQGLQWPWLLGLAGMALQRFRADWLSGTEIAALGILAVLAPPLIAFTVFFCFMHSARHILRTFNYFAQTSPDKIRAAAFAPMLLTLCLAGMAWIRLGNISLDARVLQIVFVGLAALTVPHMGIVERVRMSGWVKLAD